MSDANDTNAEIDVLLEEGRTFAPPEDFSGKAHAKNVDTDDTTSSGMPRPAKRTGNTACGCSIRFKSIAIFLNTMRRRTIFTEPAVDPAQPPVNMSMNKSTRETCGHAS